MELCSVNMDAWYYRIGAACDTVEREFILLSSHLCWCGPLHLAFPDDVAYASTNIWQLA